MNDSARMSAALAVTALALAGCATLPAGAPPQSLELSTRTDVEAPGPMLGWGTGPAHSTEELAGAECTATNDLGSWTVVTPGVLAIKRSKARLRITCRMAGYRDAQLILPCITPRSEGVATGAYVGLRLAQFSGPGAVVAAPVVAIAAIVGATAVGGVVGGVAGARAPEPDVCAYGAGRKVEVHMVR